MGGNAIKSAKRIDKLTFEQYCKEIKGLFPELTLRVTRSFRQKTDFGDIDIVVCTDPKVNIKNLVRERVKPTEEVDNGPFYSFLYKDAQVDFIFHSLEDFKIAYEYYSWNDVCNFIGRVARSMNFKFGHDGLSYEEHLDDHYKITVPVSKNIDKILNFLGYSVEEWRKGFDTIEDILAYGASSKYFNALYFDLNEQNNADRVRNKKRKMYQNMLKYIEEHNIQPKPKLTDQERKWQFDHAAIFFKEEFGDFDWVKDVEAKKAEYARYAEFKTLFNGEIVKQMTGLEGKELGLFMQRLKSKYNNLQEIVLAGGSTIVDTIVSHEKQYGK